MRLGKFYSFAVVASFLLSLLMCETESKPFMMSMGQAIGGAFFSIWKAFDNTPNIAQNRTSMKRAPAFASKYSFKNGEQSTSSN